MSNATETINCEGCNTEQTTHQTMKEQFQLLANWNREHIDKGGFTEQVRLNVETMLKIFLEVGMN